MIFKLIDWYLARQGQQRGPVGDVWDWVPVSIQRLTAEATLLAKSQENKPAVSGEYKRHQVYAQMIKNNPEVPRRNISWALERGVRFSKGI